MTEPLTLPPPEVMALLCDAEGRGKSYVSLSTNGDGACGLHAMFGRSRGGRLECDGDIREVVAFLLEDCMRQVRLGTRCMSSNYEKVCSALWSEFCVPCAKAGLARGSDGKADVVEDDLEPEAVYFWEALSAESQRRLCRHIQDVEHARQRGFRIICKLQRRAQNRQFPDLCHTRDRHGTSCTWCAGGPGSSTRCL